jgi:CheY-like chemotaxis protein
MNDHTIAVLTSDPRTRRQVARALRSGGMKVEFLKDEAQIRERLSSRGCDLLVLDCDDGGSKSVKAALRAIESSSTQLPVVLIALHSEAPFIDLLDKWEVSHLLAGHGALRVANGGLGRPAHAVLDERELFVTCDKVLSRDIFGIDKYIGSRGVAIRKRVITGVRDKEPALGELERYLRDLQLPAAVVPDIGSVAEEFIVNAIVHAPRNPDGTPKYEHRKLSPELVLEPNEHVTLAYGCDGQRLMLSVTDNFGGLSRKTIRDYLKRAFSQSLTPESKPGGAGLGFSLALRCIHQLIFNVEDGVRTEVVAGWFVQIQSANEFKHVGKSLNVFWLPSGTRPIERNARETMRLRGRIDESFALPDWKEGTLIDMRDVTAVSSRGLVGWLEFVRTLKGRGAEIVALPETLISYATTVTGVLDGLRILTVFVPFECAKCGFEERRELEPEAVLSSAGSACPECNLPMRFAGFSSEFEAFLKWMRQSPR